MGVDITIGRWFFDVETTSKGQFIRGYTNMGTRLARDPAGETLVALARTRIEELEREVNRHHRDAKDWKVWCKKAEAREKTVRAQLEEEKQHAVDRGAVTTGQALDAMTDEVAKVYGAAEPYSVCYYCHQNKPIWKDKLGRFGCSACSSSAVAPITALKPCTSGVCDTCEGHGEPVVKSVEFTGLGAGEEPSVIVERIPEQPSIMGSDDAMWRQSEDEYMQSQVDYGPFPKITCEPIRRIDMPRYEDEKPWSDEATTSDGKAPRSTLSDTDYKPGAVVYCQGEEDGDIPWE